MKKLDRVIDSVQLTFNFEDLTSQRPSTITFPKESNGNISNQTDPTSCRVIPFRFNLTETEKSIRKSFYSLSEHIR
jgi:hypothetical protein